MSDLLALAKLHAWKHMDSVDAIMQQHRKNPDQKIKFDFQEKGKKTDVSMFARDCIEGAKIIKCFAHFDSLLTQGRITIDQIDPLSQWPHWSVAEAKGLRSVFAELLGFYHHGMRVHCLSDDVMPAAKSEEVDTSLPIALPGNFFILRIPFGLRVPVVNRDNLTLVYDTFLCSKATNALLIRGVTRCENTQVYIAVKGSEFGTISKYQGRISQQHKNQQRIQTAFTSLSSRYADLTQGPLLEIMGTWHNNLFTPAATKTDVAVHYSKEMSLTLKDSNAQHRFAVDLLQQVFAGLRLLAESDMTYRSAERATPTLPANNSTRAKPEKATEGTFLGEMFDFKIPETQTKPSEVKERGALGYKRKPPIEHTRLLKPRFLKSGEFRPARTIQVRGRQGSGKRRGAIHLYTSKDSDE